MDVNKILARSWW